MPAARNSERQLAAVQKTVTEKDVLLPEDERAEVEEDGIYVQLRDREFKLNEAVPIFTLMEWSAADNSASNLAAAYHVIKALIHKDDWAEFAVFARETTPVIELKELIAFQNAAFEELSGNPTEEPAPSSPGPSRTSAGSTASSSRRRAAASNR